MEDESANIEVLIGFGNDIGDGFSTVLRKTFAENGKGSFCMKGFSVEGLGMGGWNVSEGMNATIQVVTGGEGGGGLYNVSLEEMFSDE